MCGITGIHCFPTDANSKLHNVVAAVESLKHRGPDATGIYKQKNTILGHSRLAVIDTSEKGNQPMTDVSGRYTIVYNGEFYNFQKERQNLIKKGYQFKSQTDTEVLLNLYIHYGNAFLERINGCFALAIYDNEKKILFVARDRYGIKPLYYYHDTSQFIFSSKINALFSYDFNKEIDITSLYSYFKFHFVPGPYSILKNVYKLTPGTFLIIRNNHIKQETYYTLKSKVQQDIPDYETAKKILISKIDAAVSRRLISNVPIGAFLSGGIDSSIIVATASKYIYNLNTFSVGYRDNNFYNETDYAKLIEKKFNTKHTVFNLTSKILKDNIFEILDNIDEPFADSSSIAVYFLSKFVKQSVTVALSGDGADEIFSGYNKHKAFLKSNKQNILNLIIRHFGFITDYLPKSRNNKILRTFESVNKYYQGLKLPLSERYWLWASFTSQKDLDSLFLSPYLPDNNYQLRKEQILKTIKQEDFNSILFTDTQFVLPYDMLTKVDSMSMANALEVRTPFLDHTIVDFIFSLPAHYKINDVFTKRLLRDAYRDILPKEIYHRSKHGFEVPISAWLYNNKFTDLSKELLSPHFIQKQKIFDIRYLNKLTEPKTMRNKGELIWTILVFQYWWNKYFT